MSWIKAGNAQAALLLFLDWGRGGGGGCNKTTSNDKIQLLIFVCKIRYTLNRTNAQILYIYFALL